MNGKSVNASSRFFEQADAHKLQILRTPSTSSALTLASSTLPGISINSLTMAPNTDQTSSSESMKKELSFATLMHVYDHDDEGTSKISKESVGVVLQQVKRKFPKALSGHILAFQLKDLLAHKGFTSKATMLGTSFCCDDVNRELEDELRAAFGNNHSLSGLAGFCFGGATAVADMLHHIPVGGNCVLVYGPHVGVDWDGVVGKVNRRGHAGSGACCGSAVAAAEYAKLVLAGERQEADAPDSILDAQQTWVEKEVLKHAARLQQADDPAVELPHAMFDCQNELINSIVAKAISELKEGCKLALVGGVQINTPEGTPEYFLPKRFELINHDGKVVEDMLEELHNSIANTATW